MDDLELGTQVVNSRAYCSWFGFKGGQQQSVVGNLSGGERNRVQLAKLLKTGANLIILDEPTNDLDVETLRSLEEGLLNKQRNLGTTCFFFFHFLRFPHLTK